MSRACLLALLSLIVLAGWASASTTISSLPYTINAPDDYHLSGDLNWNGSLGHAIRINSGGAGSVIHFDGHTITQTAGSASYYAIYVIGNTTVYGYKGGVTMPYAGKVFNVVGGARLIVWGGTYRIGSAGTGDHGMYSDSSPVDLHSCVIATNGGKPVYFNHEPTAACSILNCTLFTATNQHAIYLSGDMSSTIKIENNLLSNAAQGRVLANSGTASALTVDYNHFDAASGDCAYINSTSYTLAGITSLDAHATTGDAGVTNDGGGYTSDLTPASGSALINSGSNAYVVEYVAADSLPRVVTSVDKGAYDYGASGETLVRCCDGSNVCQTTNAATCTVMAGTNEGTGSCAGYTCVGNPEGACCAADGSCTVTTEGDCAGTWQGAETNCDPNLCPQPEGACCKWDGTCTVTTHADCDEASGQYTWSGIDTVCDPNSCAVPTALVDDYSRPRFLIGAGDLAGIRTRCLTDGSLSAEFGELKTTLDGANDRNPYLLGGYAFAYLVTQDDTYAAKAWDCVAWGWIKAGHPYAFASDNFGMGMSGIALFYDYCYDWLSAPARSAQMDSLNTYLVGTGTLATTITNPYPWMWFADHAFSVAVSLAGEGVDDANCQRIIDEGWGAYQTMQACRDANLGEGAVAGYTWNRFANELHLTSFLDQHTVLDSADVRTLYWTKIPEQSRWKWRPDNLWERTPGKYNTSYSTPALWFSEWGKMDPKYQAMAGAAFALTDFTDPSEAGWAPLALYDPDAAGATALDKVSGIDAAGYLWGRDAWYGSEPIQWLFDAGARLQQPLSAGHLQITRGSDVLLGQQVIYVTDLDDSWVMVHNRSTSFNTLRIINPAQSMGIYETQYGVTVRFPNDGSQVDADATATFPECDGFEGAGAEITANAAGSYTASAVANLTDSYSDNSRATSATRRVTWLMDDWWLVQDKVIPAASGNDVISSYHVTYRPVFDDATRTVLAGSWTTGGVFAMTAGVPWSATSKWGASALEMHGLIATGGTEQVRMIGGKSAFGDSLKQAIDPGCEPTYNSNQSFECWVDDRGTGAVPRNWAPITADSRLPGVITRWRVASGSEVASSWTVESGVTGTTSGQAVTLATLLRAKDASDPEAALTVDEADATALKVGVVDDTRAFYLVALPVGSTATSLTYSTSFVGRHYIIGLQPSTELYLDHNAVVTALVVDAAGVASFNVSTAGNGVYAITDTPGGGRAIRKVPEQYASLRLAMAACSEGDSISIDAGTYDDNSATPIAWVAGVCVGGAGAATTTLRGTYAGKARCANMADVGTVLVTGLTFTGFAAVDAAQGTGNHGGAFLLTASSTQSVTFSGCAFDACEAGGTGLTENNGQGGAIAAETGPITLTLSGCTFTDCVATYKTTGNSGGGAVYSASTLVATNCDFGLAGHGNSAPAGALNWESFGGAIFKSNGVLTLTECRFTENASVNGGAVLFWRPASGTGTIQGCTFTGNTAEQRAGALWFEHGASPTISDCLFQENTATTAGGAITAHLTTLNVTDSRFLGNESGKGGAVCLGGGWGATLTPTPEATFSGCAFQGNNGTVGGCFYAPTNVGDCTLSIDQCTFVDNSASSAGGCVGYKSGISSLTLDVDRTLFAYNYMNAIGTDAANGVQLHLTIACADTFATDPRLVKYTAEPECPNCQNTDPQFCQWTDDGLLNDTLAPNRSSGLTSDTQCGRIGAYASGCGQRREVPWLKRFGVSGWWSKK